MLDKGNEQTELERSQTHGQTTAEDEPPAVVDRERSVLVVLDVGRLRRAPQQCLDPREQLLAPEGLHDVVVGAGPKPSYLVDLAAAGCEQDHRHVAHVADSLERFEAVELRQREVEDDEVGRALVE